MSTSEKKTGLIWCSGQSGDLLDRAKPDSGSRRINTRRTSALAAISAMLNLEQPRPKDQIDLENMG